MRYEDAPQRKEQGCQVMKNKKGQNNKLEMRSNFQRKLSWNVVLYEEILSK
jgi:hypothetical protein